MILRTAKNIMPNEQQARQVLWWLPAIVSISVILFLSTQPFPRKLPGTYTDKLVHFCVYGVLSMLAYLPLLRKGHPEPLIGAILLSAAVGILDETLQYFNPHRTASFADLLADGFGAFFGGILLRRALLKKTSGKNRG